MFWSPTSHLQLSPGLLSDCHHHRLLEIRSVNLPDPPLWCTDQLLSPGCSWIMRLLRPCTQSWCMRTSRHGDARGPVPADLATTLELGGPPLASWTLFALTRRPVLQGDHPLQQQPERAAQPCEDQHLHAHRSLSRSCRCLRVGPSVV